MNPMNHMPLNRIVSLTAIAGVLLVSTQAPAGDWKGQSLSTKRQIISQVIDCMRKRMYGDRAISYNEAAKACKEEVRARLDKSTAGPLVAADTAPK